MGGSTTNAAKKVVAVLLVALVGCVVGTDGAPQALREGISSDRALQEVSSSV